MKIQKVKLKIAFSAFLFIAALIAPASVLAAPDPCANTTDGSNNVVQSKVQKCINQSPIVQDIQLIVNFLSAGVGIVITAVIIIGGIQYMIAGDNPQSLTAARQRITNGLIALFVFLFAFAFLQWLVPGGVFK